MLIHKKRVTMRCKEAIWWPTAEGEYLKKGRPELWDKACFSHQIADKFTGLSRSELLWLAGQPRVYSPECRGSIDSWWQKDTVEVLVLGGNGGLWNMQATWEVTASRWHQAPGRSPGAESLDKKPVEHTLYRSSEFYAQKTVERLSSPD